MIFGWKKRALEAEKELKKVREVAAKEREHYRARSIRVEILFDKTGMHVIATDPAGDRGKEIDAAGTIIQKYLRGLIGATKSVSMTP